MHAWPGPAFCLQPCGPRAPTPPAAETPAAWRSSIFISGHQQQHQHLHPNLNAPAFACSTAPSRLLLGCTASCMASVSQALPDPLHPPSLAGCSLNGSGQQRVRLECAQLCQLCKLIWQAGSTPTAAHCTAGARCTGQSSYQLMQDCMSTGVLIA